MRKIAVARLSQLPVQLGQAVRIGELELALFRLPSGDVYAVENSCPHKGGPLSEGIVCGTSVFCPLHDWKINLVTGRAEPPDKGCVRTFPVTMEGDRVFLILSEEIRASANQ